MDTTNKKQTLVEEGTEFSGSMKSSCAVVVHGTFDGEIEAPELDIAETGAVQGIVRATRLRSEGILAGTIDADEVYLSGAVCSNTKIRASKLELKLSQPSGKLEVSFGEHATTVSQESTAETAVNAPGNGKKSGGKSGAKADQQANADTGSEESSADDKNGSPA